MTDLTQQQREALEALDYVAQAKDAISGLYQSRFSAEAQKLQAYILNSTPVPAGWKLVPEEAHQELDHPDDGAVVEFSHAMRKKMADARAKGRSGWDTDACLDAQLARQLVEHTYKANGRGNFADVANLAMMLWHRQSPPSELAIAAHQVASEQMGQDGALAYVEETPVPEGCPQEFIDWLRREMPPNTLITAPDWWAPRIYRRAMLAAAKESDK